MDRTQDKTQDLFDVLQKTPTALTLCGKAFALKVGGRLKKRSRVERIDNALKQYRERLVEIDKEYRKGFPVLEKLKAEFDQHQEAVKAAEENDQPIPMFDTSRFSIEEALEYQRYIDGAEPLKDEPLAEFVAVMAEVLNEHIVNPATPITTEELIDEFDEEGLIALADVAKNGALEGPNFEAVRLRRANSPQEPIYGPSSATPVLN